MNSLQKTQEYIKGKSPLFIFIEKKVQYNDIERSQTAVFYFSYNVTTVACNATTTLGDSSFLTRWGGGGGGI